MCSPANIFGRKYSLPVWPAEFDQQRADHGHAHVVQPGTAVAHFLLKKDQLLAGRDPHPAEFLRPVRRQPPPLRQRHVPGLVVLEMQPRRRIAYLRGIIRLDPAAHMRPELVVGQESRGSCGGGHGVGSLDGCLSGVAVTEARVGVRGQSLFPWHAARRSAIISRKSNGRQRP